jgi:predicted ATPase
MVGRQVESSRLARAMRVARADGSACVLLVGEAGVGKTRLLTETASAARAAGMAVFVGRAAIASPTPFGVIAEALRSWQRDHPMAAVGMPLDRGLGLILPEWPQPAAEPGLSAPQVRLLAFEGVVRLVHRAASDHNGALVVLDDLHAADPESIETTRYLASASVVGVCIVGGLRPWEGTLADGLVRGLGRDGVADVLDVESLDANSAAELVHSLTSAMPPPEFVDEIMSRTDGVPLLIEEIVAAHLRAGSVGVAEGAIVWRGEAVAVPRTVREMVSAR